MFYTVQKDFYLFLVNGIYYVQFRDPATRKLLSKITTGQRNRTKAEKWAKEEYERRSKNAGKSDITFGEYARQFYIDGCPHEAARKADGLSFGAKTKIDNRYRLETHILTDSVCKKCLCDLTRPDSVNFRDRIIKKLGYTRKAQLTFTAYRNIINTALAKGMIKEDPILKVSIKLKNKKKRQATSVDNVKNILLKRYWPNKTIWRAAMTAGIVGLRAGEISGLRWKDIDLENETINVIHSINLQEGEKTTKSGKPRVTTYPRALQALIEPYRGHPEDYAFSIKKDGQPLAYYAIRSAMTRAMTRAVKDIIKEKKEAAGDNAEINEEELVKGIKKITLHGLRHSINTALLEAGVNPELLQASFGWVDKETQEIYTHRDLYNLAPQREATDKLFEGFIGE
jgi:integrase